jgi:hypothetical protein
MSRFIEPLLATKLLSPLLVLPTRQELPLGGRREPSRVSYVSEGLQMASGAI